VTTVSRQRREDVPFIGALRRLRDPLLLTAVATSLVGLSALGAVNFAEHLESAVGNFADYYGNIWWAGHRILDGKPAAPDGLTAWPPTATVFVAPFALLPYWVGLVAWTAVSVGAFVAGLYAAGCRDRRALLVAAMSPPALACAVVGNLSLVLAAGVAFVWAYRDRAFVSGLTAGAVVAAKFWLWPLLLFFVLTRRWLSLAAAGGWIVTAATVWLVLSPSTMRGFPAWSDEIVENCIGAGVGLASALASLGMAVTTATALALAAGLMILVAAVRAKDELTILACCIAAALVASPLVWEHYYAVLFVPIAALAPRLSALWFVPYLAGFKFLWLLSPNQIVVCGIAALVGIALVTGAVATRTRSSRDEGTRANGWHVMRGVQWKP
jgi:hypothetical protein